MSPSCQCYRGCDKSFGDIIQVDKESSSSGEDIESLVQVLAKVDLGDDFADCLRNALDLLLRTHRVYLVMQSLGYLKDRMDEEAVLQLRMVIHEELQHHLTELVLHTDGEVVQQTKQILKANEFREVLGSHHDLH